MYKQNKFKVDNTLKNTWKNIYIIISQYNKQRIYNLQRRMLVHMYVHAFVTILANHILLRTYVILYYVRTWYFITYVRNIITYVLSNITYVRRTYVIQIFFTMSPLGLRNIHISTIKNRNWKLLLTPTLRLCTEHV